MASSSSSSSSGLSGKGNPDQSKKQKNDAKDHQGGACGYDEQCCMCIVESNGVESSDDNDIGAMFTFNKDGDIRFFIDEDDKIYVDSDRKNYICNPHHIIAEMGCHPSKPKTGLEELTLDMLRAFCKRYKLDVQGQDMGPYVSAVSRTLLDWTKSEKDSAVWDLAKCYQDHCRK